MFWQQQQQYSRYEQQAPDIPESVRIAHGCCCVPYCDICTKPARREAAPRPPSPPISKEQRSSRQTQKSRAFPNSGNNLPVNTNTNTPYYNSIKKFIMQKYEEMQAMLDTSFDGLDMNGIPIKESPDYRYAQHQAAKYNTYLTRQGYLAIPFVETTLISSSGEAMVSYVI